MSRSDPALSLRVPAELKERLERSARENGRSLNSEVVWRLWQWANGEFDHREEGSHTAALDRDLFKIEAALKSIRASMVIRPDSAP